MILPTDIGYFLLFITLFLCLSVLVLALRKSKRR